MNRFRFGILWFLLAVAFSLPVAAGGFGGGGPLFGAIQLQLTDLNQSLEAAGFSALDETIGLVGGGGGGGPRAWSVGGMGFSGTTTSVKGNKEASLTLSFGGFHGERTFSWSAFTFGTGVILGGGEAELKLSEKLNTTDLDSIIGQRSETLISSDLFVMAPTLSLRVKITDFLFVKAQGAYLASLGDWKFQGSVAPGMPNVVGPVASVAVVFGGGN